MAGISSGGGGMSASGGAAGPSTATGGHQSVGGFTVGDYYADGGKGKRNNNMVIGVLATVALLGTVWLISSGGSRKK